MKRWMGLALLVFVGSAGWRIGDTLSADALSMAVGVLFGVMAGVPAALLLMASGRRRAASVQMPDAQALAAWPGAGNLPQPARVIVLAGSQDLAAAGQGMGYAARVPVYQDVYPEANRGNLTRGGMPATWPVDAPARRFKVVGEQEAWLDEW